MAIWFALRFDRLKTKESPTARKCFRIFLKRKTRMLRCTKQVRWGRRAQNSTEQLQGDEAKWWTYKNNKRISTNFYHSSWHSYWNNGRHADPRCWAPTMETSVFVFYSVIMALLVVFFFFLKWRRKNYVSFSIVLYLHAGLAPEVNVGRIFTFVIVPPTFFFIFKDGQVQYFFWCHPQNFVPGHCIFRRKRSKSKRHFNVIQSRRPFQKAFSYRRHIQERKEKKWR